MSIYHNINIENISKNNNNNNNDKNNNDNLFEEYDLQSLDSLKYTNDIVKEIMNNFKSYKWRKYNTNVLMLDIYNKKKETRGCFDSLYVNINNNNNNTDDNIDEINIKFIYITPHIIFLDQKRGCAIVDIINMAPSIKSSFEDACIIPTINYRSWENKSVEFFRHQDLTLMDDRYVSLGTFYEYHRNKIYLLKNFETFLQKIYHIFTNTNFIPYFIHPDRLILQRDQILKVISPSLFQYIHSPYAPTKKLRHRLYSHPRVLHEKETKYKDFDQKMIKDIVNLFLDFFHSCFVTILWIYNNNNNNNNNSVIYSLTRNEECLCYDIMKTFPNRKQKTTITTKNKIQPQQYFDFDENYIFHLYMNDNNNNNNNEQQLTLNCKNVYGFCLCYSNVENIKIREIVHNYGCQHLQLSLPIILDNAMKESNERKQMDIFNNFIAIEFNLLIQFLNQLVIL